jgi:hypothetical protein
MRRMGSNRLPHRCTREFEHRLRAETQHGPDVGGHSAPPVAPESSGIVGITQAQVFATDTFGVVELQLGPDKDLWWVDLGGSVHRVSYTGGNQAPVAKVSANPTSGPVPLAVSFDGRGSSDPDAGDTIASWSWDLDGDGCWRSSASSGRRRGPSRRCAGRP